MIGVWGLGREGASAIQYLLPLKKPMLVVDERVSSRPQTLPDGVEFYSGEQALEQLLRCALVVVSPAVPRVHHFRQLLEERGVVVTTGTNLWMRGRTERIIGVTGTKGKSTTASLISLILGAIGLPSDLAGNIGVPLTDLVEPKPQVVAELSSYQCAYLERSPSVAVLTSLYQDHLPWHGSLHQYLLDKTNIFAKGAEVLICSPSTLSKLQVLGVQLPDTVRTTDDPFLSGLEGMDLPASLSAPHNVENLKLAILAAAAVTPVAIEDLPTIIGDISHFENLPHRLQVINSRDDRLWVDDSLSTTGESVIAAVSSFPGKELVLIVGGMDRGIDYAPLNEALVARTPKVQLICMPENGASMVDSFRVGFPERVRMARDMEEAVAIARGISRSDAVIVLSPGAPSHNLYSSFESKSAHFAAAVQALPSGE